MSKRADEDIPNPLKRRPEGARQHATAGPYSPVLEVDAQRLVVISGQVAVDLDGRVIGSTIEEQTRATLGNCTDCLASAGCTLGDVFKVNIYLADLGHWARFNEIYEDADAGAPAGANRGAGDPAARLSGRDRNVGGEGEGIGRGIG